MAWHPFILTEKKREKKRKEKFIKAQMLLHHLLDHRDDHTMMLPTPNHFMVRMFLYIYKKKHKYDLFLSIEFNEKDVFICHIFYLTF